MKQKLRKSILAQQGDGFTLIELLTVISVISFMASVILVPVNNARQRAKETRARADIQNIYKGFAIYRIDNGDTFNSVPWDDCWVDANWNIIPAGGSNNICSQAQWNSGWFSNYVRTVPIDPWGHQYLVDGRPEGGYECGPGQTSICSFGPNGVDDGSVNNPAMVTAGDDVCQFFETEC